MDTLRNEIAGCFGNADRPKAGSLVVRDGLDALDKDRAVAFYGGKSWQDVLLHLRGLGEKTDAGADYYLEEWAVLAPESLNYYARAYVEHLVDCLYEEPDEEYVFWFFAQLDQVIRASEKNPFEDEKFLLIVKLADLVLLGLDDETRFPFFRNEIEANAQGFLRLAQGQESADAVRGGWLELGTVSAASLRPLCELVHIDRLAIKHRAQLTAGEARSFRALKSVGRIWLWRDVTRAAMRHVISIPGLRTLDVLRIRHPGRLEGFSEASSLETFRCNLGLTASDLSAAASCETLREIGAQSSELTPEAIDALLGMPALQSLDLEGSNFDDAMAARLAASQSLRSLDIGATRITRQGLAALGGMKGLVSLDLWSTAIHEEDLDLLADLPNLESISIGHAAGEDIFDAATLLPRLRAIRSLRSLWLDGVRLDPEQTAELEATYEKVHITPV